jgi:guanosine-3',5'-bis(diphosphate) 3'-pyrophosphohydrolase
MNYLQVVQVFSRTPHAGRVLEAILFADCSHLGQVRKSGGPFMSHPLQVAILMAQMGGSEVDVLAALLHDVPEDSAHVSLSDLDVAWGSPVALRVEALTKDYRYEPHLRALDAHGRLLQAVARFGPGVAAIKLADRCHNSATSQGLPSRKLVCLQKENQHLFAPLAHMVGAHGLGQFLAAEPSHWWSASTDFISAMRGVQAPFLVS